MRAFLPAMLGLGIVSISSAALLIRWLRAEGAAPLPVAGHRLVLAALLLAPSLRRDAIRREHLPALAAAAVCLAVHFGTFTAALYHIPVARAVVLADIQPLFVVLASWWFLGERASRRTLGCLALALLGIAVMFAPGWGAAGASWVGDLLALLSALSITGYVLVGRRLRQDVAAFPYAALVFGGAGILLLAAAAVRGAPLDGFSARGWGLLLALAVVPTLGGHAVFNWALRHVPATTVSTAFLAEPVGAALLALVFLAEVPDGATLAGGILCLIGVAGVVSRPTAASSPPSPDPDHSDR